MDNFNEDICRRHSCRVNDRPRVLPSQLSKPELEELYFTLMESNVDLKKTVNSQAEKLKVLSTKLNRATSAQKRHLCRTQSKCCTNAHVVIDEQKNIIDDMHQGQSRLLEKNRQLNMKLCTRKQFSKGNASRRSTKYRSSSVGAGSRKSEEGIESDTNIASTVITTRSQKSYGDEEKTILENTVNVNEPVENYEDGFKSEIVELKHKIRELHEELSASRNEYAVRLQALEAETARVQAEARSRLQEHTQERQQLNTELRRARSNTSSLATELFIEKKKVAELHAQVRAATLAQEVVKMLDDHLTNVNKENANDTTPSPKPEIVYSQGTHATSCYQDVNEPTDNKCLLDIIEQLMKKISNLQSEIDVLKVTQRSNEGYAPGITHKHKGTVKAAGSPLVNSDTTVGTSAATQAGADHVLRGSIDAGVSPASPAATDCCDGPTEHADSQRPSNSNMLASSTLPAEEKGQDRLPNQQQILTVLTEAYRPEKYDSQRDSRKFSEIVENTPTNLNREPLGDDENANAHYEYIPTTDHGRVPKPQLLQEQPSTSNENSVNLSPGENKSHEKVVAHTQRKLQKGLKKNSDPQNLFPDCECMPTSDGKCPDGGSHSQQEPAISINKESWSPPIPTNSSIYNKEPPSQRKPSKIFKKRSNLRNLVPNCECTPTSDGKCPAGAHLQHSPATTDKESERPLDVWNSTDESPNERHPQNVLKKRSDPRNLILDCECMPTSDGKWLAGAYSQPSPATTNKDRDRSPGEIKSTHKSPNEQKPQKVIAKRNVLQNLDPDCEYMPTSDGKCPAGAHTQQPPPTGKTPNRLSPRKKIREDMCLTQRMELNKPSTVPTSTHKDSNTTILNQSRVLCLCGGSESFKTISLFKNKLKSCIYKPSSEPRARKLSQTFTCMTLETSGSNPRKDSSSSVSSNKTYTVTVEAPKSSSTNNTERDVESIPDKSEKDAGYSTNGEDHFDESDRTNTELTSYSETADTSKACSDGEVPSCTQRTNQNDMRASRLSTITPLNKTFVNEPPNTESTSSKVEEALKAISLELCKCRELLMTQKQLQERLLLNYVREQAPREPDTQAEHALMLKKTVATAKIPEAPEHLCSFTLHVGTIILSDEAVVSTRSKELFLQWRFYDQNYTITPIDGGRVVHFSFSTQYVVSITTPFLNYLTHAQMIILISEIGKQMEPFAYCAFPLREVLANPNQRVDISSALLSGGPPPSPFDESGAAAGTEVGVLDLWCILRYDEQSSHLFEAALAQIQTPKQGSAANMRRERVNPITVMDKISEEHDQADQDAGGGNKAPILLHDDHQLKIDADIDSVRSDLKRARFHEPACNSLLSVANQEIWNKVFPQMPYAFESNTIAPEPSSSSQDNISSLLTLNKSDSVKKIMRTDYSASAILKTVRASAMSAASEASAANAAELAGVDRVDVTVLWLALIEQCPAMSNSSVVQLYVAYSFLGRSGADLETPTSKPKPSHYAGKVHFNFKKRFYLEDYEKRMLAHMARCRSPPEGPAPRPPPPGDTIVFSVMSEPAEDPIGIENCEEIGRAHLYLGDLLTYCSGDSYTEVVAVYPISPHNLAAEPSATCQDVLERPHLPYTTPGECSGGVGVAEMACGVLAVRVDGLNVVRQCASSEGAT